MAAAAATLAGGKDTFFLGSTDAFSPDLLAHYCDFYALPFGLEHGRRVDTPKEIHGEAIVPVHPV